MAKRKKIEVKMESSQIEESVPVKEPQKEEKKIIFEGAAVEDILKKDPAAYLCKMSDGTTKWVPIDYFL